jgi:hypothetical protein
MLASAYNPASDTASFTVEAGGHEYMIASMQ